MKRAMNQSPAIKGGLSVTMSKLFAIFVLCLGLPALSLAQDPLSPSYLPAIDTNPAAYPSNIWVTDTMQKIRQQSSVTPGTQHWGTFYGSQGEFVDFQVHVTAPAGGYSALNITTSSFVQASPSSFTISASTKNIVVYREAYMDITTITNSGPAYYDATGWYPDALIPAVDPYFSQATNAFPVAVPANYNQSAWVDVFIPQNAPSGYYLGSITVSNSGTTLATLPVVIGVWQWPSSQGSHMPATSSLATNFATSGWATFCDMIYGNFTNATCGQMPFSGGNNGAAGVVGQEMGEVMFLDHRISQFDNPYLIGPLPTPMTNMLAGIANTNFTTIIPGAAVTGIDWGAGNYTGQNYTQQAWDTLFQVTEKTAWPTVSSYNYVCDEPGSGNFSGAGGCNAVAATAHALTPPFPVMMTATYANASAGGGLNSIDYFVVEQTTMWLNQTNGGGANGTNELTTYQSWLATPNPDGIKRQLWSYESCSSGGTCGNGTVGTSDFRYPNDNIDGRPASNRAMEWMSFMNGQVGELTFATTCAWVGMECYNGSNQDSMGMDPWVTVYLFGNNGDGTLAYASTYSCNSSMPYPQTNCPYATKNWVTNQNGTKLSYPLWIPSIRLKNKRDGFQDYEYLKALTTAGRGNFVNTQIASWITNLNNYEYTGTGLMTARTNLGTALHQLTYPSVLMPPPSLTGTVQ
jgi:hypothetical protein